MNRAKCHLPWRSQRSSAFSLLEVLIASTLFAFLVAIVLGVFDGASPLWSNREQRREPLAEIRAGLRMMSEDLHSAVLTAMPETLQIGSFLPHLENSNSPSQSIFFLVSHPSDQLHEGMKGDLCAIGYFVAPAPEGQGVRNLYRFHASGDDVAQAYEKKTLPALYATASPGNENTELLARNITSLEVQPISHVAERLHPEALRLTLSAINGKSALLIAVKPEAAESREHNERTTHLLQQHQLHLSSIVSLPPERDMPLVPGP